jgi:CBS domain-containing protein
MKVWNIMKSEARVCYPWMDLASAGRIMLEVDCGVLPVLNESEQVVGVITDRDICLAVTGLDEKPSNLPVADVMSGELYTCAADDEIHEALDIMRQFGVRRLPVVDEQNRLQGILSIDDVVLEARALGHEGFTGPFYSDIARTLKGICSHPSLALVS